MIGPIILIWVRMIMVNILLLRMNVLIILMVRIIIQMHLHGSWLKALGWGVGGDAPPGPSGSWLKALGWRVGGDAPPGPRPGLGRPPSMSLEP